MDILDLFGAQEFSPDHHVQKSLTESPRCAVSIACWEPGQTSPIHSHPHADEIYHVLTGEALFSDGRTDRRLGAGGTVLFPAGEVHRVTSVARTVLYRVQAGPDRGTVRFTEWPQAAGRRGDDRGR